MGFFIYIYIEVKQCTQGCLTAKSQEQDPDFKQSERQLWIYYLRQAMTHLDSENTVCFI